MIDVADIKQTLWHAYPISTAELFKGNHSGVEDYTPNIFSNISREYHVKEVDKAKGINSNFNSESYCRQDNY